jgi:hypothetical protein
LTGDASARGASTGGASIWGAWRWAGTAVLAGLVVTMAVATGAMVGQIGAYRADERDAHRLASAVRDAGIRAAYSDYWTCDRLMFLADEKVACAVLDDHLRAGQDRYHPVRAEVASARTGYLFVAGGPGDVAFRDYLRVHGLSATVTTAGRYDIYRPAVPLHLG